MSKVTGSNQNNNNKVIWARNKSIGDIITVSNEESRQNVNYAELKFIGPKII